MKKENNFVCSVQIILKYFLLIVMAAVKHSLRSSSTCHSVENPLKKQNRDNQFICFVPSHIANLIPKTDTLTCSQIINLKSLNYPGSPA